MACRRTSTTSLPSWTTTLLAWHLPSGGLITPPAPRPCRAIAAGLSSRSPAYVDLDFVPPHWPPVDFTDAYVSAHVLHVGHATICGRHPPAVVLAATSSAVGPGAPAPPCYPGYHQPACLASLLSAAALLGMACGDPDDYLGAHDVCPGPMPSPSHVWSHLMAGVTALACRASEASLAEPDLLRLDGPRPPDLPLGAVDLPRGLAAWPGGSSDSGGDDFCDATDSLADELAAVAFSAGMMD